MVEELRKKFDRCPIGVIGYRLAPPLSCAVCASLRRRRYSGDTKRSSPRPTKREITTQEFICVPVGPLVVCDVIIRFPDLPAILRPEHSDHIPHYSSNDDRSIKCDPFISEERKGGRMFGI